MSDSQDKAAAAGLDALDDLDDLLNAFLEETGVAVSPGHDPGAGFGNDPVPEVPFEQTARPLVPDDHEDPGFTPIPGSRVVQSQDHDRPHLDAARAAAPASRTMASRGFVSDDPSDDLPDSPRASVTASSQSTAPTQAQSDLPGHEELPAFDELPSWAREAAPVPSGRTMLSRGFGGDDPSDDVADPPRASVTASSQSTAPTQAQSDLPGHEELPAFDELPSWGREAAPVPSSRTMAWRGGDKGGPEDDAAGRSVSARSQGAQPPPETGATESAAAVTRTEESEPLPGPEPAPTGNSDPAEERTGVLRRPAPLRESPRAAVARTTGDHPAITGRRPGSGDHPIVPRVGEWGADASPRGTVAGRPGLRGGDAGAPFLPTGSAPDAGDPSAPESAGLGTGRSTIAFSLDPGQELEDLTKLDEFDEALDFSGSRVAVGSAPSTDTTDGVALAREPALVMTESDAWEAIADGGTAADGEATRVAQFDEQRGVLSASMPPAAARTASAKGPAAGDDAFTVEGNSPPVQAPAQVSEPPRAKPESAERSRPPGSAAGLELDTPRASKPSRTTARTRVDGPPRETRAMQPAKGGRVSIGDLVRELVVLVVVLGAAAGALRFLGFI